VSWRGRARHLLEQLAAKGGPQRWARGGQLVVLAYHRVLPPGHPALAYMQPGMYVHPATLRMHLELLGGLMPVVSLGQWLRRAAAAEPLPARAAAITFDDGWRDNFEYAFPLLRARGVQATMFLVTGRVGSGRGFWPERLARLVVEAGEDAGFVQRAVRLELLPEHIPGGDRITLVDTAIEHAKHLSDLEAERRIGVLEESVAGRGRMMSALAVGGVASTVVWPDAGRELVNWEEVRTMARSGVIEFGSHTRDHRRLGNETDPALLAEEIAGSKRTLEQRLGVEPELFCFPNGDVGPAALALVRRHYRGACTTRAGWNGPEVDPWQLRRVTLHEDGSADPTRFLARLSGWL